MIIELTKIEEKRYYELLEKANKSWEQMAEALTEIRDKRLYRADYPTFEIFVREKFGKSREWAYKLIATEKAVAALPEGAPRPKTARAARKLLPKRAKVIEAETVTLSAEGKEQPKQTPNEAFWQQVRTLAGDIRAASIERRLGILKHHVEKLSQMLLKFA
jgi:hypothetical protein